MYRFIEPDKNRMTNNRVANIEFLNLRDSGNRFYILIIQPVTGIDLESQIIPQFCTHLKTLKFTLFLFSFAIRVGSRMKFNHIHTES